MSGRSTMRRLNTYSTMPIGDRRRLGVPRGCAFSLVEMMIAIVILGLGLVMVATMFPVAWGRARTLSEHTVERSITPGAEATLRSLLQPAGLSSVMPLEPPSTGTPQLKIRLNSGSLAGDLFYDPTILRPATSDGRADRTVLAYSDTRVHALNIENLPAMGDASTPAISEHPWHLERVFDFVADPQYPHADYPRDLGIDFPSRSYQSAQVRFSDRVHPPLDPRPTSPPLALTQLVDVRGRWDEQLAKRRFAWAILHRLREPVGPAAPTAIPTPQQAEQIAAEAAAVTGTTRVFDVYYVILRRPRPTHRYARQQTGEPNPPPDPTVLTTTPAVPAALSEDQDVMFPVPWRVQVQFPEKLASRTATVPGFEPTGIPTEIEVPAAGFTGSAATGAMLVQMFPTGAKFVDEITGAVYTVAKRRVTGSEGQHAFLTLDREVVLEEIDLPAGDARCELCVPVDPANPAADGEELLRTVWVYPPPVDRTVSGSVPALEDSTPVVDVKVGTLSLSPSH